MRSFRRPQITEEIEHRILLEQTADILRCVVSNIRRAAMCDRVSIDTSHLVLKQLEAQIAAIEAAITRGKT